MRYRRSKRFRVNLLKLSGYRCDECGAAGKLEVHHDQPLYQGGNDTADNCVVLCIDCHIAKHRKRPISQERRAWNEAVQELTL